MIIGMHHASITTRNLVRLADFYCDLLGFETVLATEWDGGNPAADAIFGLADTAVKMRMLRTANCFLELFEFVRPPGGAHSGFRQVNEPGFTHICIQVSDIDTEYARLSAAGMPFNCPPQTAAGLCRATYGRDPDGNIIELMEVDPEGPFAASGS